MDIELLDYFCLNFFGYGSLDADYWFIGMEEGGKNSIPEFYQNYIEKWDKSISVSITDGINKETDDLYFNDNAKKVQKTWGGIIKLLLTIEGKEINKENMLSFQKHDLGRKNNLLLELMPLPHQNTSEWDFQSLELSQFETRDKYFNHYLPYRTNKIKELISQYNPKVVVFYSTTYIKSWKEIIGINEELFNSFPFVRKINRTIFVICKHPAARGITNAYYPEIGNEIRRLLLSENTTTDVNYL